MASPMLTVESLARRAAGSTLAAGDEAAEPRDPLGPHLRARGPDPVAVGRRAAADHRYPADHGRQAARASSSCSPTTTSPGSGFGIGFEHKRLPKALVDEAAQRGSAAVRGPLRDAVHRDHREGLRAARQRAVRGAAARRSQVHERLERLVLEERGLERDRCGAIAAAVGGAVADARRPRTASSPRDGCRRRARRPRRVDADPRRGRRPRARRRQPPSSPTPRRARRACRWRVPVLSAGGGARRAPGWW